MSQLAGRGVSESEEFYVELQQLEREHHPGLDQELAAMFRASAASVLGRWHKTQPVLMDAVVDAGHPYSAQLTWGRIGNPLSFPPENPDVVGNAACSVALNTYFAFQERSNAEPRLSVYCVTPIWRGHRRVGFDFALGSADTPIQGLGLEMAMKKATVGIEVSGTNDRLAVQRRLVVKKKQVLTKAASRLALVDVIIVEFSLPSVFIENSAVVDSDRESRRR